MNDTGGSGPGRRAVLRWAWRLYRKEWRQQVLVLALVTVAVAVAVTGAAATVNAASGGLTEFGTAHAMVRIGVRDAATTKRTLAAASERFGPLDVIAHGSASVPGSTERLDLRSQDPKGRYSHGMLSLREGRYPTGAHEIALTPKAADLLSTHLGATVVLDRRSWKVVGLVENPQDLRDEFGLLRPGDRSRAQSLVLLIDTPRHDQRATATPSRHPHLPDFGVMVRGDDKAQVAALVLAMTTLAMALVGLIATAGFVVAAQRRQRQLGLLAAIGATERHLRLVVTADGALVGATAALLGGAFGVLGWMVVAPAVETAADHRIDRWDLPWNLVLASMGLAVVMSTAAAWWPGRSMSRLPVMRALSGRPSPPRPVHRSLVVALVLIGAGFACVSSARPTGNVRPLLLMGGIVALVIGVVFSSPAAIRLLALPARHLPFSPRLALRDLVRYQARAAAAVAAITLGLGIAVTVVVLAQANEYRSDEGNLSSHQLLIEVAPAASGTPTAPDIVPTAIGSQRTQLDAAARLVAASVPHAQVLPLDIASGVPPADANANGIPRTITVARELNAHSFRDADRPYVATDALLRHFGIDPATIAPSTDLVTSLVGRVVLLDPMSRDQRPAKVQHVDLPAFTDAPTSFITQGAMRRHGWTQARSGWLVESTTAITTGPTRAARRAAAEHGLAIDVRSTQDALATLRVAATAVGVLLALAIVAMTIGLIRAEARRDVRTLTAAGASPRTRRTLTASTAGALALLGALLGTGGAYLALVAAYHSSLDTLGRPPVGDLLLIGLGLPTVAAVAGWLLAGREPTSFARQALD